jgi:SAM-dependent methyltransferase
MSASENVTSHDGQAIAASPNKALWEKGDFTRIAVSMRASGEEFVQQTGIERGMKVLDIGCGDGTTAIPAAQLGAEVLGVDIASNLVAAANQRATQFGVAGHCRFIQGDACDLSGIENKTFDRVTSVFGAMFAPKPFDVAREMVRVTRPGGKIVMGNWIPNDPTLVAQLLKISAAYSPPPPEGFVSPMLWGVESHIHERFGKAGIPSDAIMCERDTYLFDFDGSPEQFVDTFRQYYGPTMNAFDAAAKAGRTQALRDELVQLFESHNLHQYPNQTLIQAAYLRVSVQVG